MNNKYHIVCIVLFGLLSICLMVDFPFLSFEPKTVEWNIIQYQVGTVKYLEYRDEKGNLQFNDEVGYAKMEVTIDETNGTCLEKWFDEKEEPVEWFLGCYSIRRTFNVNGKEVRTEYLDNKGQLIEDTTGCAWVEHSYRNGLLYEEYYYAADGEKVKGNYGHYGIRWIEYDDEGTAIEFAYLDENGEIVISDLGYARARYDYSRNGTMTIWYYDVEGEPVALNRGQYGIRYVGNKTIYLNENGNKIFILEDFLLGNAWMIVLIATVACFVLAMVPKGLQITFAIVYVLGILFFTIFSRNKIEGRIIVAPFSSYGGFLYGLRNRIQIVSNIWMFIPLGAVCRRLFGKRWIPFMVVLMVPVAIECIQYWQQIGYFEFDDIINNCTGSILGVYIEEQFMKVLPGYLVMEKHR